jgi:hypothetical protein
LPGFLFHDEIFSAQIDAALKYSEPPAELFEIEVTENIAVSSDDARMTSLQSLRAKDVGILVLSSQRAVDCRVFAFDRSAEAIDDADDDEGNTACDQGILDRRRGGFVSQKSNDQIHGRNPCVC